MNRSIDAQGQELAKGVGMPAESAAQFIDVCKKLYKCYWRGWPCMACGRSGCCR